MSVRKLMIVGAFNEKKKKGKMTTLYIHARYLYVSPFFFRFCPGDNFYEGYYTLYSAAAAGSHNLLQQFYYHMYTTPRNVNSYYIYKNNGNSIT